MRIIRIAFICFCVGILCACCQGEHPSENSTQKLHIGLHKLTIGDKDVYVEIANSHASRSFGLMQRKSLPQDEGMIFVYPEADFRSFWMKDTLIPLSLAYIDRNGRIFQLVDMEPLDESSHPSTEPAQFALEVNQGWFEKNGIKVGDTVANLPSAEGAEE